MRDLIDTRATLAASAIAGVLVVGVFLLAAGAAQLKVLRFADYYGVTPPARPAAIFANVIVEQLSNLITFGVFWIFVAVGAYFAKPEGSARPWGVLAACALTYTPLAVWAVASLWLTDWSISLFASQFAHQPDVQVVATRMVVGLSQQVLLLRVAALALSLGWLGFFLARRHGLGMKRGLLVAYASGVLVVAFGRLIGMLG